MIKNENQLIDNFPPASFFRRIAALFYDTLILLSLLILASAIIVSLNGGKEVSHESTLFKFYLLGVIILYFALSWTYGRQTVGMRAWRLFLVTRDGQNLTMTQAIARCSLAILTLLSFGIGYWWMLFNKQKQSLHDMIGPQKKKKTT